MAKWCELLFPLYSVEFLNLSDDNNSHQSFPWAPLKAARFTEKQNGLLRHSNVQSNTSDTASVPTSGTFKWWSSCLMNVRLRKFLVAEARFPSRYTGFDSVKGKKNSSLIKGYDGTTQGGSGGEGTSWSEERIKWPIEQYFPPHALPFKVIDVYYIYVTLMNILWRNPLFREIKSHFAMVNSKSASLNCNIRGMPLKKNFQGRSVSASLLLVPY